MTTLHDAAQQAWAYWVGKHSDHLRTNHNELIFKAGFEAALAQQGEHPVPWPQTPEQISDFIGSNFKWREGNDAAPKDGDIYCVTAHDLLSAFYEWAEFAAAPAAQPDKNELKQLVIRYGLECMANHGTGPSVQAAWRDFIIALG